MAVSSRDMKRARHLSLPVLPINLRLIAHLVTALLALTALYILLSNVVSWGHTKLDDLRYGTPRTFHLSADVGHAGGAPSHLIAMNLDRQVVVFDIPGGDIEQIRTLPGPYLFGANENLTPVTMNLTDVNRDEVVDLVVQVKEEEIIYINRDGQFSLISPEERQQLVQQ